MSRAKRRRPSRREIAELDDLYQRFVEQPALITDDEMRAIEAAFHDFGVHRRLALGVMARTGQQLIDINADEEGARTCAQMIAMLEAALDKQRQLGEVLTTARTRLQVSMCDRADMDALIAAARKDAQADVVQHPTN